MNVESINKTFFVPSSHKRVFLRKKNTHVYIRSAKSVFMNISPKRKKRVLENTDVFNTGNTITFSVTISLKYDARDFSFVKESRRNPRAGRISPRVPRDRFVSRRGERNTRSFDEAPTNRIRFKDGASLNVRQIARPVTWL